MIDALCLIAFLVLMLTCCGYTIAQLLDNNPWAYLAVLADVAIFAAGVDALERVRERR